MRSVDTELICSEKHEKTYLVLAGKRGFFHGGLEGIRTLDPHNANVVRSQLRYKPVSPEVAKQL